MEHGRWAVEVYAGAQGVQAWLAGELRKGNDMLRRVLGDKVVVACGGKKNDKKRRRRWMRVFSKLGVGEVAWRAYVGCSADDGGGTVRCVRATKREVRV